jgi:cytidylate kinase
MANHIITIAREYGSGGRIIGERLAKALGFAFYDKELISLAAKESGYTESFVQAEEQKRSSVFLYNLFNGISEDIPAPEKIFIAQSNIIQNIANEHSAVIIGRCADYVLKDHPYTIKIFIHAPLRFRINTVRVEYGELVDDYTEYITKMDKTRANYYNYFTQAKWGKAQNYQLCLDSSIGFDTSIRVLKEYADERIRQVQAQEEEERWDQE